MKLYIKNMVCPRCIMAVKDILSQLEINAVEIRLGEVILSKTITEDQTNRLQKKLRNLGFDLLDDAQQKTIEQIKTIIINNVHHIGDKLKNENISEKIASTLNRDYAALSKLFSVSLGITIEQFLILQKTEKVKELLTYGQKTISEIAFEMNYSSVAHLSAQFKKITGLTPSQFKAQGIRLRKSLDNI